MTSSADEHQHHDPAAWQSTTFWPSLLAIAIGIAAGFCAATVHAQAAPAHGDAAQGNAGVRAQPAQAAVVRCVTLELYMRSSDAKAKESVESIRAHLKEKPGIHLKTYDLDQDAQGVSRLKALASAYKLGDPQLPLVYGLNTTAASIASRAVWQARLTEMLRMEVFTRKGCPRCAKAEAYLPSFAQKYPGIHVRVYEVLSDPQANRRFVDLAARHRVAGASYPGFWVCQHLVIGFDNQKGTADRLDEILSRWTFQCKLAAVEDNAIKQEPRETLNESLMATVGDPPVHWSGHMRRASLQSVARVPDDDGEEPPSLPIPGEDFEEQLVDPSAPALPLPGDAEPAGSAAGQPAADSQAMEIPWFGRFSAQELGMPLFTLTIGLIDGFNPCAMWVLLFLLSVLVNLHDRWKILVVAGTFVLVSGLAYFAFMAAWLNVLLLVGFLRWVQITLAILAILVGTVHIKDYFAFKKGISLSIPDSAKPRIYEQVRRVVTAENLSAAIIGAIALAVLVNIVELLCTAGLPALYTQVLSQQGLPGWKHYAYLALYILAYMFDDAIMVGIVVATLGRHKLQETEGRWLKLISGLVILALGLVLLLKPEWLG